MLADAFEITGPAKLDGALTISGSKNAALPILFASLMCTESVELDNVPDVVDIRTTLHLFKEFGIYAVQEGHHVRISPGALSSVEAKYDWVKKMRASVLCLGPLLTRYGEAIVSFPGGCSIGARPINLHLDALKFMGAHIDVYEGYVHAKTNRLKGATIMFPRVTVTGTENVVCAASLAEGQTTIYNAAQEPEVVDLCKFLKACGALIEGEGSSTLRIQGVSKLSGTKYSVMCDRIEYGTYAIAAAATRGRLVLMGELGELVDPVLSPLRQAGVSVTYHAVNHQTDVDARKCQLRSISVSTAPYPGFATDLQAQWMALMTQADGVCVIQENVFENRFLHAAELMRLGAKIEIQSGNKAIVTPTRGTLTGADVMATDLRASASLVIAGLVSEGVTRIRRIYHLDRGYEHMEKKLASVTANIRRIDLPL